MSPWDALPDTETVCVVPTTQGRYAIVDADDTALVAGRWTFSHGYATRTKAYKRQYMHRVIMAAGRGEIIDHINGNTLDNRKSNLRRVSKGVNNLNRHRLDRRNTSGFTGVYYHKRKHYWYGQFAVGGKKFYVSVEKTALAVAQKRSLLLKEKLHALGCFA